MFVLQNKELIKLYFGPSLASDLAIEKCRKYVFLDYFQILIRERERV